MPDPASTAASSKQHDNNKQDSISLLLPERSSAGRADSSSSIADDNLASKDGGLEEPADVERGLDSNHNSSSKGESDISTSMRGRQRGGYNHAPDDSIGPQWKSPLYPEEDHTHPQYLPPFFRRSATSILSLPIIKPMANYISGGSTCSRLTSSQPHLWNFKYLDKYIEIPLIRYTKKWTRYPLILWSFLLAWFLGFTFLARAAWWNSGVGNDVQWLDGTSTYWQRNDGCGLGGWLYAHFQWSQLI